MNRKKVRPNPVVMQAWVHNLIKIMIWNKRQIVIGTFIMINIMPIMLISKIKRMKVMLNLMINSNLSELALVMTSAPNPKVSNFQSPILKVKTRRLKPSLQAVDKLRNLNQGNQQLKMLQTQIECHTNTQDNYQKW